MKKLSYLYGETTCFSANFTFVNTFAVVLSEETRRIVAGWRIMFTCVGAFLLSYAASSLSFPGLVHHCLFLNIIFSELLLLIIILALLSKKI
jgi:hypothetical protein